MGKAPRGIETARKSHFEQDAFLRKFRQPALFNLVSLNQKIQDFLAVLGCFFVSSAMGFGVQQPAAPTRGESRGLSTEDAVNMIVSGFCKQVFLNLPMEFAVERGGLSDQHQECGLESVLGIVRIVEHTSADPHDHRAVPADEGLESCLLPLLEVKFQQVVVSQARSALLYQNAAEMPDKIAKLARCHETYSLAFVSCPIHHLYWSNDIGLFYFFSVGGERDLG